ncbi:MAG: oligosaccharide flippase family protein [Bacteroidales bacterium]|nr:oligosaccharide flippase family protein [Bacteroidales bacterium]
MLQDIKKASKHSIIYSIGNIGIKIIGLILIPYYTNAKFLSHDDFGALAILEATMQLASGFLGMALSHGLKRWYWDKKHIKHQKDIFFTAFSFLLAILIPVILLLLTISDKISLLIFDNIDYVLLLKLTLITAGFKVINGLTFTLLKLKSKSVLFALVQISSLIITLTVIIGGLIYKNLGLEAIWIGNLVGEIFIFIALSFVVVKNISFKFNTKILVEMFNYGLPLMLTSVAGVILLTTDRYMLNSTEGLVDTGIYSLGSRIANTLQVIISTSLVSGLTPLLMKKMNDTGNQRYYSKIMTYTSFIFVLGLIGLSLFSLEILKVFTNAKIYWESAGIVAIVSYALLFGFIRNNANIGLIVVKDTKSIGILTLIISIFNIGLNYFFIPLWNIYGAAFATLISQLLFLGFMIYISQKKYFIPYEWKKIIILIILSAIVVFIGYKISFLNVWLRIGIKSMLLIGFPFVLFLFNFYDKVEIESVKDIVSAVFNSKKAKKKTEEIS